MNESLPVAEAANDEPAQDEHKSRRPLWLCGGFVLLLIVATAYANLWQSRTLHISTETTYITEPLKSDGKQVDYFRALQQATYPANIATEDNGYRLIVQHLGPSPESTPARFADLCSQLGLDASEIRPDMAYDEPRDFLVSYVNSSAFTPMPPTNNSAPALDGMLGAQREPDPDLASNGISLRGDSTKRTTPPWRPATDPACMTSRFRLQYPVSPSAQDRSTWRIC